MTNEATVTMPMALTPEMLRAVKEHDTTRTEDRDEWHRRLGWLLCAWDILLEHRRAHMERCDCTSSDEARTLNALAALQAAMKSAKVQKLAQTTNLRDLNPTLLAWLGTTSGAERQKGGTGAYTLVRDLSHDVWVCTIGGATGYGRTFADAVLACREPPNVRLIAPDTAQRTDNE